MVRGHVRDGYGSLSEALCSTETASSEEIDEGSLAIDIVREFLDSVKSQTDSEFFTSHLSLLSLLCFCFCFCSCSCSLILLSFLFALIRRNVHQFLLISQLTILSKPFDDTMRTDLQQIVSQSQCEVEDLNSHVTELQILISEGQKAAASQSTSDLAASMSSVNGLEGKEQATGGGGKVVLGSQSMSSSEVKISFRSFEVGDIALFLVSKKTYIAFHQV